jgi:hypothetical protein
MNTEARTDWFHRARWGVSSTYLADLASNTVVINLMPARQEKKEDMI